MRAILSLCCQPFRTVPRPMLSASLSLCLSACLWACLPGGLLCPVPGHAAGPAAPTASKEPVTIVTGKVMATVTRAPRLPFNAIVDKILVRPGDAIAENAPLMRYHLQDEAGRLLQQEVTQGAGTEDLKSQALTLERTLAETIAQRNKASQLSASGLGSRQALKRLEGDVKSLQTRLALMQDSIAKSERSFESRLKELEYHFGQPIAEGQHLPESLVLRSPINGYVLSLEGGLNPGVELAEGSSPILVGQLDPVLIQVPVYEGELSSIKLGDTAEVDIPSLKNKKFTAKVSEISWVSTDMNVANPSYYTVELTVPNPGFELKPGFKAVVRFKAGR